MVYGANRSVTTRQCISAPWVAPLLVGVGLRIVAALVGFGWFAPDDYHFVIEQSGHWLQDPGASFPCEYRSNLLPRLFWILTAGASALGFDSPTARLRCAYLVMGLVSTAAIPAIYKLTLRHADMLTARAAAWLGAAFFLMPRITTRPLIESASMVPLAWGALWLDRARAKAGAAGQGTPGQSTGAAAFWAATLIGMGCLFRFQAGVLVPPFVVLLATGSTRRDLRLWAGAALGAIAVAGLQIALDASEGRAPFSTPLAYLRYNLGHAQEFGESPWFTYLGHFLGFTLPPATLALAVPFVGALRRHAVTAVLFCSFVGAHSLIGHKEDRFMFPVLPLFFVLLATALEQATRDVTWRPVLARLFWVLNALALIVATCSDAQRNLTRPFLQMARESEAPSVATVGLNLVPRFYLGERGEVFTFDDVEALNHAAQQGARFDFVLLRNTSDVQALKGAPGLRCGEPRLYYGDWLDRLLVRVNRHNERRDATALVTCSTAVATCIKCGG